jgi:FkbM family methyltransferase
MILYMYKKLIIIISIIILLSILLIKSNNEKFQNENVDDKYNINPPTKTIEHPGYGIIKCISNDLAVCEAILQNSIWEEQLFKDYFEPHIKEDTTVLDCGAYIGSHTILMKKLNRNNDIFAFEMMPEHYKILQDNIKLNNFDNILAFNFALGDKIDRVKLPNVNYNDKLTNYGGTSIQMEKNNVDIPLITLDFIMPIIKKPVSFIKIDVEGHEIELLLGAKKIIEKYKPIIEIEIWDILYDKFNNSQAWIYLESLGYKIKKAYTHDYLIYY